MANGKFSPRPHSVGSGSGSVGKTGSGHGSSRPVGSGSIGAGRSSSSSFRPFSGGSGGSGNGGGGFYRRGGGSGCGCSPLFLIILAVCLVVIVGGGSLIGNIFGGTSIPSTTYENLTGSSISSWSGTQNLANLDRTVASGSRDKYTVLKGDGSDIATIMVYMCGSDLETEVGSATSDILEMCKADISNNVNVLVFTGGAKRWNNDVISSSRNQIFRVVNGGLVPLKDDAGNGALTDPDTLLSFLQYTKANYAANRYALIFWDHGSGSVAGFGYDEKHEDEGAMSLAEINNALSASGMKFDFVGFDACLMGSVENALMLSKHADYLIASEETEPGDGWYYTDWLSSLSANSSLSTLDIGKKIIDDYTAHSAKYTSQTSTTLSLVDLAEASNTIPPKLSAFSQTLGSMINSDSYKTVSQARTSTKEFAQSSQKDQIDLAHFAEKIGNSEGKELASAITGAVKYNVVSHNVSNAYGLSVFFPYYKTKYVDSAVDTYEKIGMDEGYTKCIKDFAGVQGGGYSILGGTSGTSPLESLLGHFNSSSSLLSQNDISSMFGSFIGNSGLNFLSSIDRDRCVKTIAENQFDGSALSWKKDGDNLYISLQSSQWELITDLKMNMFVYDGEGFIDLGRDMLFYFEDNRLYPETDHTWLSIDGHICAFYFEEFAEDGSSHGYIPALINGEQYEIIVYFDENGKAELTGTRRVYNEEVTETLAKDGKAPEAGDKIQLLCDYYDYKGNFENVYNLGSEFTLSDNPSVENIKVENNVHVTYVLTDIYGIDHWTETIEF